MALFFADLVREACHGTGPGDLPLDGALPGHRRFADAVPPGARFHYCIAGVTRPQEWETGEGEIGSGGAIVRLPLASSAAGALVDFSPGLKTVALTVAADWFAAQERGGNSIDDIEGLEAALAGKAALGHAHDASYSPLGHVHSFEALADTPTTLAGYGITDGAASSHDHDGRYAASAHGHAVADVAGLQPALDGKAALAGAEFGGALVAGHSLRLAAQPGRYVVADISSTGIDATNRTGFRLAELGVPIAELSLARDGSSARTRLQTMVADSPLLFGTNGLERMRITADGQVNILGALDVTNGSAGLIAHFRDDATAAFVDIVGSTDQTTLAFGNRPLSMSFNGVEHLNFDIAGTARFKPGGTEAARIDGAGLAVTGAIAVAGSQVVATRRAGWGAPSGTASRATFDTASATTEALAQRLKALIDDLAAHGLIGA